MKPKFSRLPIDHHYQPPASAMFSPNDCPHRPPVTTAGNDDPVLTEEEALACLSNIDANLLLSLLRSNSILPAETKKSAYFFERFLSSDRELTDHAFLLEPGTVSPRSGYDQPCRCLSPFKSPCLRRDIGVTVETPEAPRRSCSEWLWRNMRSNTGNRAVVSTSRRRG